MRTLVVSDGLVFVKGKDDLKALYSALSKSLGKLDFVNWTGLPPQFNDYDVIVLDTCHLSPSTSVWRTTGVYEPTAWRVIEEFTKNFPDLVKQQTVTVIITNLASEENKTLYNFFNDNALPLVNQYPPAKQFTISPHFGLVRDYFDQVEECKTKLAKGFILDEANLPYINMSGIKRLVEPLAVMTKSNEIISGAIDLGNSYLVFLPGIKAKSSMEEKLLALTKIGGIAAHYFKKGASEPEVVPEGADWVENYFPKDKEYDEQILTLKEKKARLGQFKPLLYGTGGSLEKSVAAVFDQWGCDVKETPSGHSIDLKAGTADGKKLAIEVTSAKKNLRKGSGKNLQLPQYFLNEKQDDEKLILIANTYREVDPSEREEEHFSPNILKVMTPMGVCVLTSYDLYRLWRRTEKKLSSADAIIRSLIKCDGLYEYKYRE